MNQIELNDRIQGFHTDGNKVTVLFFAAAAPYHLSADREDFAQQVENLAAAWKAKKAAKVVLRGSEIVSITLGAK